MGQVMRTISSKNYNIALLLYAVIATIAGMAQRPFGASKKWMNWQPLTLPFAD
jgi:hypothetical protein